MALALPATVNQAVPVPPNFYLEAPTKMTNDWVQVP